MEGRGVISELNMLLWEHGRLADHCAGVEMDVAEPGTADETERCFRGAEVRIGGTLCRGTVYFTEPGEGTLYRNDAILQVVHAQCPPMRLERGEEVCQAVIRPPEKFIEYYVGLSAMRDRQGATPCGDHICGLPDVKMVRMFFRLFAERTERKYREAINPTLGESKGDWNYAMYLSLFRAMGGSAYKAPYEQLARRVSYTAVAHEKASPKMVEAMLLGASGLLDGLQEDDYVVVLKRDFDHARRKYGIEPMKPAVWSPEGSYRGYPFGYPIYRISLLSAYLSSHEFILDALLRCRKPADVYALFRSEAPEYWSRRFSSPRMGEYPRRMSYEQMDRMGINFVVPMLFAYGEVTGDDNYKQAAQELIDAIPAEENKIIKLWRSRGVQAQNACDTQALLELNNEYCARIRCAACPAGRTILKKLFENGHTVKCY